MTSKVKTQKIKDISTDGNAKKDKVYSAGLPGLPFTTENLEFKMKQLLDNNTRMRS